METVLLDMNDAFPGKADPHTFPARVAQQDMAAFAGKHVQLRGCAPAWAHMLVAAKLQPVVCAIDFLIDDGKDGVVVPIFRSAKG